MSEAESRREPLSEEEEGEGEENGALAELHPEKTGKEFKKGDTALAMHQGILYDARVEKVDVVDGQRHYYVHYMGWNKKWDEWQTELLEHTPNNQQLAKELKNVAEGARSNAKRGFEKRRKRQRPSSAADGPVTRDLASIPLTFQLKRHLVDDWEMAKERKRVAQLPCKPTVRTILTEFVETRRTQGTDKALQVVASGIRDYFDRLLGTCLLYDTERAQYDRLVAQHPGINMCDVYGAEHLLRLFVRLEELLPQSEMNAEDIKQLVPKLKEILKFINNDHLRLFTAKYVDPGESQAVPKSMDDAEAGPSAGEAAAAETQ